MKYSHKLHYHFEPERLTKDLETAQLTWVNHFNERDYDGSWTGIPLRAPKHAHHPLNTGDEQSEYEDTELLKQLEYIPQVIETFKCRATSVRLLKLAPEAKIKEHTDPDLSFWNGYIRLHVPILTNEQVNFTLDGHRMDMKPGECWFAEFSKTHSVYNGGATDRIHLVMDCEVNDWVHELFIQEGIIGQDEQPPSEMEQFDDETRLQIIRALEEQGTETSLRMAKEIRDRYSLPGIH
ncbi:MAG: aspartyl/asparaginyl beta-hydroxylase domain-containing protein [Bacteroidota bacterium]